MVDIYLNMRYTIVTVKQTRLNKIRERGDVIMARGSKTVTAETHLECKECGNTMTIHRKRSRMREKNHIKHMYCPTCREETAHIESKEDLFLPLWLRD